jgi:tetratricopeptide (TPR) repeat protein
VRHKSGRTRRRLTRGAAAKAAAGAAIGLALGWWVIKTSAADALVRRNPAFAAAIAPNHPDVRISLAMSRLDLGTGEFDAAAMGDAQAGLARAPLAEEPFLFAGLGAARRGRFDEAERFLSEARRRNPRLRAARLFLLDRYLRQNRMAEAAGEVVSLRRLVPEVSDALAPQLAQLARDERTGAALMRVLAREPDLQQAVLDYLAGVGTDPDLILRVASAAPARPSPEGLPWQRRLLASLVAHNDDGRALSLWRSFAGLPPGGGEKGVYDGRFQRLPGAAPFNWQLSSQSAGGAEYNAGPALAVEFFGRETADLAGQLMVLRPGRYRLRFRAEGSAKGDDSRLAWRVACNPGNAVLLDLPIRDVNAAPRDFTGEFTVPGSCPAQWLRLTGIAGEFPGTQSVTIGNVDISPAGGR